MSATKRRAPAKTAAKTAVTKTAKKTPAKPSRRFPFPFFGQGEASYYEWFDIFVWFRDAVPAASHRALLADAPPPCKRDVQWPHPTLLWASTGDQWIHRHLIETYGTKARIAAMKKELKRQDAGDELDFEDDEDDDRLAATLAGTETIAFNAHIERWLLSMNAKRPILFVARREDGEAGGTRPGPWHKDSVARFAADVLPTFEELARGRMKKDDDRREALGIVIDYVGAKKLKPAIRKLAPKDD